MKRLPLTLILLLIGTVMLLGCLRIESKDDKNATTPSPIIIYVNASPQIIVTVTTTVVPTITVTEKIIYPSKQPTPSATPKGGLIDLGERIEYETIDLSKAANADYHHNPFKVGDIAGKSLFPELNSGKINWGTVPFEIAPDYISSGKFNTISTGSERFFSTSVLTGLRRFSSIYLLMGSQLSIGDKVELGSVKVNYQDGEIIETRIVANENIWNYEIDQKFPIPAKEIAWTSKDGNLQLSGLSIKIGEPLKPIGGLTIKKSNIGTDSFAIFAITGVKKFNSKRISHANEEFQNLKYNRIYTTTLPEGAMINYVDEGGKRSFRPEGTFESPIFDGETELVDWKILRWNSLIPQNTGIKIEMRTGNSPKVDRTWSEWTPVENGQNPALGQMFMQWRALLSTTDSMVSPVLKEMIIEYENPSSA